MLRIQSGTARGRLLKGVPPTLAVRPILARIRKSLFDILRPHIADTAWLDLFAGAGTVGIEALSNGAGRVVFVEQERKLCQVLERNLTEIGFQNRASVRQGNAVEPLFWLSGEKFDIVFLGPPYVDLDKKPLAYTAPTLGRLLEANLVGPGTWVIAQHHKKEPMEGLSPRWEKFRENVYGDSVLTFFRLKEV